MVQSETGLSKVHFEASLELGTSTGAPEAISAEVKKIKGPTQLAPENLRCQNPGCSLQPLEEGQLNSSKVCFNRFNIYYTCRVFVNFKLKLL